MSETDTNEHIRKIQELLPEMEAYNEELIDYFEVYLRDQTMDKILLVCNHKQGSIARSSYNTYKHIRLIHWITDIVVRELSVGFCPITEGITSYKEAIDKYRMVTYMLRRHELMNNVTNKTYIDEATEFIFLQNVSPIAIHDIIINDICFDAEKTIPYWKDVLHIMGRDKDALLLGRM